MAALTDALERATDRREELRANLAAESTDAYRLFHGVAEGFPGVAVDRYGELILIQSFHDRLDDSVLAEIEDFYRGHCEDLIYQDRSRRASIASVSRLAREPVCREMGVQYLVLPGHKGPDPGLFLDMRAARRVIRKRSLDATVLNLFAYTCSLGISAALGGATKVTHIDFSKTHLAIGKRNAALNPLEGVESEYIVSDFFPAVRQLNGIQVKARSVRDTRSRKRRFLKTEFPELLPRRFDVVLLDPPPWSKSFYGTVDLINDYQSVFKPALLCTEEGGTLFCTNNVAKVSAEEWRRILFRCAEKAGRPVRDCEILTPESDFPSLDGNPPLKIAVLRV